MSEEVENLLIERIKKLGFANSETKSSLGNNIFRLISNLIFF